MTPFELQLRYETLQKQLEVALEGDSTPIREAEVTLMHDLTNIHTNDAYIDATRDSPLEPISIDALEIAIAQITSDSSKEIVSLLLHEIERQSDLIEKEKWDLRTRLASAYNCEFSTLKQKIKTWELDKLKQEDKTGKNGGQPTGFIDVQGFIRNSHGKIKAGTNNAKLLFQQKSDEWKIEMNEFSGQILVNGEELNDNRITEMLCWAEQQTGICPWQREQIQRAAIMIAGENTFNPIKTYLDGLVWDREERLRLLPSDVFNLPNTGYYSSILTYFFVQAVARVYEPGCKADYALTLIGHQGCGKSTFVESIVPFPDLYLDYSLPHIHDKDAYMVLAGKWHVEIAEGYGLSKSEVNAIKAFMSRKIDSYRAPYAKIVENHPRKTVFTITTNEETPLRDTTGNRRFWIVQIPEDAQIDNQYIASQRDQLWAESVSLYKNGHSWHYETDETREQQQVATETDAYEEFLRNALATETTVTMSELAQKLEMKPKDLDRSKQTRIGIAMSRLGWKKHKQQLWQNGKNVQTSIWQKGM